MLEENKNPYNLVDHPDQVKSENSSTSEKKESGQFFKKLIKTIAKLAGLPDPETGEPAKSKVTTTGSNIKNNNQTNESANTVSTTLDQDVAAQEEQKKQEEEKKKFSFENVMSGVTGVLDKIEKKVEEKTAPLKKREEKLNDEESQTEPEIEVDKNNEEYLSENH